MRWYYYRPLTFYVSERHTCGVCSRRGHNDIYLYDIIFKKMYSLVDRFLILTPPNRSNGILTFLHTEYSFQSQHCANIGKLQNIISDSHSFEVFQPQVVMIQWKRYFYCDELSVFVAKGNDHFKCLQKRMAKIGTWCITPDKLPIFSSQGSL